MEGGEERERKEKGRQKDVLDRRQLNSHYIDILKR